PPRELSPAHYRGRSAADHGIAHTGRPAANAGKGHNARFPYPFQWDSGGRAGDVAGVERPARRARHAAGRQGVAGHRHLETRLSMRKEKGETPKHWLAALLLSAVLCHPVAAQQPQRLTLNFTNTDIEAVTR